METVTVGASCTAPAIEGTPPPPGEFGFDIKFTFNKITDYH